MTAGQVSADLTGDGIPTLVIVYADEYTTLTPGEARAFAALLRAQADKAEAIDVLLAQIAKVREPLLAEIKALREDES